jgi:hypothetical protein
MCGDRTSCQVCFLFQPPLLAFLCTFLSNQLTIELRFDSSELVMLSLFVLRMNVRFNCCRYRYLKTGLPYATVEAFKVIRERYTFCFFFNFLEVLISMFFRLVVAYHHFRCSCDFESISYCKTAQCLICEYAVKAC